MDLFQSNLRNKIGGKMKKYFVNELSGQMHNTIKSYFAITQKQLRKTKNGKPYIAVECIDKTGHVRGNIWDNAKTCNNKFTKGDIVNLTAEVELYSGNIQLNIKKIRKAKEEEYEMKDFLPTVEADVNELTKQFLKFIETIENQYLKELLDNIFGNTEFLQRFVKAPAAKTWHHSYLGGLLKHSLTVTRISDFIANLYPEVNRDLLVCCAMLHDIGKMEEYTMKPFIDFTNKGSLVGHIVLGNKLVVDHCENINNFPENLKIKIQHLLLSHHGEREKGAVMLPKIREAILLHFADNMDAQVVGVDALIKKAQEEKSVWTDWDNLTGRKYFTK